MKQYSTIILMLLFCTLGFGQTDSDTQIFEKEEVSEVAEYMDGGEQGLLNFLFENFRYPQMAYENNISGKVTFEFTVNIDSTIKDVKLTSAKIGFALEIEAERVLRLTNGKWIPAVKDDKIVPMRHSITMNIQLR